MVGIECAPMTAMVRKPTKTVNSGWLVGHLVTTGTQTTEYVWPRLSLPRSVLCHRQRFHPALATTKEYTVTITTTTHGWRNGNTCEPRHTTPHSTTWCLCLKTLAQKHSPHPLTLHSHTPHLRVCQRATISQASGLMKRRYKRAQPLVYLAPFNTCICNNRWHQPTLLA